MLCAPLPAFSSLQWTFSLCWLCAALPAFGQLQWTFPLVVYLCLGIVHTSPLLCYFCLGILGTFLFLLMCVYIYLYLYTYICLGTVHACPLFVHFNLLKSSACSQTALCPCWKDLVRLVQSLQRGRHVVSSKMSFVPACWDRRKAMPRSTQGGIPLRGKCKMFCLNIFAFPCQNFVWEYCTCM